MSVRVAVELDGAGCVEGALEWSSLGTGGRGMEEVVGSLGGSMLL